MESLTVLRGVVWEKPQDLRPPTFTIVKLWSWANLSIWAVASSSDRDNNVHLKELFDII